MPTLPGSLALATIADGSLIIASDHRNNYAAIQTFDNTLLGILDDGAAGDVLTGVGTTLAWAKPAGYQWDRKTITSNVSITATTEGTANTVAAGNSVSYDGTEVRVEFFCPNLVASGTGSLILVLLRGATVIGQARYGSQHVGANTAVCYDTPSAAAHIYTVKAFTSAGTATVEAGAGGAGNELNAVLRVTKA